MGNLLEKIIDPITIMIRVVVLMAGYFWLLWEFLEFFYFLESSPRILGGLTWGFKRSLQLVIVRFHPLYLGFCKWAFPWATFSSDFIATNVHLNSPRTIPHFAIAGVYNKFWSCGLWQKKVLHQYSASLEKFSSSEGII